MNIVNREMDTIVSDYLKKFTAAIATKSQKSRRLNIKGNKKNIEMMDLNSAIDFLVELETNISDRIQEEKTHLEVAEKGLETLKKDSTSSEELIKEVEKDIAFTKAYINSLKLKLDKAVTDIDKKIADLLEKMNKGYLNGFGEINKISSTIGKIEIKAGNSFDNDEKNIGIAITNIEEQIKIVNESSNELDSIAASNPNKDIEKKKGEIKTRIFGLIEQTIIQNIQIITTKLVEIKNSDSKESASKLEQKINELLTKYKEIYKMLGKNKDLDALVNKSFQEAEESYKKKHPAQSKPQSGSAQQPDESSKDAEEISILKQGYIANISKINLNIKRLEEINSKEALILFNFESVKEKNTINQIQQLEKDASEIEKENFNLKRKNDSIVHEGIMNYGIAIDVYEDVKKYTINKIKIEMPIDEYVNELNDAITILYARIMDIDEELTKKQDDQKLKDEMNYLWENVSMLKSMITRRIIAEKENNPDFNAYDYIKQHHINMQQKKKQKSNDDPQPVVKPTPVDPSPKSNDKPVKIRMSLVLPQGEVQHVNTVAGKIDVKLLSEVEAKILKDELKLYFKRELLEKLKEMNIKLNLLIKKKDNSVETKTIDAKDGKTTKITRTIGKIEDIEEVKVGFGDETNGQYYEVDMDEVRSHSR